VNGLSNGGGMTYILACELAGHVAAVGFVSGGYFEPEGGCRPSRPMPVIAFHGNADELVPYEGGRLFVAPLPFAPVRSWVDGWVARDGCAPGTTEAVSPHVTRQAYTRCAGGSEVVFYTIDGGGHTWPGGEDLPAFIAGHTTHEIDASRLMWAFFEKHARRPEPAP
jgi:polyhydroxybutyrate depolymerase